MLSSGLEDREKEILFKLYFWLIWFIVKKKIGRFHFKLVRKYRVVFIDDSW